MINHKTIKLKLFLTLSLFFVLHEQVVELIRDDILPYATSVPSEFVVKIMNVLNKGSIHSATSTAFIGTFFLASSFRVNLFIE